MTDRKPGAPGQYKVTVTPAEFQKLQAGEQFTMTLVRDDLPITEGTPYSKAAVLPDELAVLLCPDITDPTPADALNALNTGKAPAGYVSEIITINTSGQADTELERIYTAMTDGSRKMIFMSVNIANELPAAGGWFITIDRATADYGTLLGVKYGSGLGTVQIARTRQNGTYGEWEWENPQMTVGVEYRTTERWQGKAVYVKAMDFGALPASGYKNLQLLSSVYDIIDWRVILISDTGGNHTIPWLASGTFEGQVRAAILANSNRTIQISTNADMSAYTATVVIKYVKE